LITAAAIVAVAILLHGLSLSIQLYGIHLSNRDLCLQIKKLRESLPTFTPED
jgi:hypothetical protein